MCLGLILIKFPRAAPDPPAALRRRGAAAAPPIQAGPGPGRYHGRLVNPGYARSLPSSAPEVSATPGTGPRAREPRSLAIVLYDCLPRASGCRAPPVRAGTISLSQSTEPYCRCARPRKRQRTVAFRSNLNLLPRAAAAASAHESCMRKAKAISRNLIVVFHCVVLKGTCVKGGLVTLESFSKKLGADTYVSVAKKDDEFDRRSISAMKVHDS